MPTLIATVASVFTSFAPKILFAGVFFGAIYLAVDKMTVYAMSYGLPVLPLTIRYLITQSGVVVALNIYIKIVTFGFIAKQTLAYGRTTN
ncbi:MAG: hypothetical protein B7X80_08705 [Sulfurovum sp. 17-42-90]|nr:MAG: hypothetical protein B7X80_08705 [Sulfurovum sp. 17-42-90]